MKDSANYVKIVEWSEEDQCFVGSCPGLFYGGCHGHDEQRVFAELCQLVEETQLGTETFLIGYVVVFELGSSTSRITIVLADRRNHSM